MALCKLRNNHINQCQLLFRYKMLKIKNAIKLNKTYKTEIRKLLGYYEKCVHVR